MTKTECPDCGGAVKRGRCACGYVDGSIEGQGVKQSIPNPEGTGWYQEWWETDQYGKRVKRRQFFATCEKCGILLPPFKLVREYQARNEPAGYAHKCGQTGKFYYLCGPCFHRELPYQDKRPD